MSGKLALFQILLLCSVFEFWHLILEISSMLYTETCNERACDVPGPWCCQALKETPVIVTDVLSEAPRSLHVRSKDKGVTCEGT